VVDQANKSAVADGLRLTTSISGAVKSNKLLLHLQPVSSINASLLQNRASFPHLFYSRFHFASKLRITHKPFGTGFL
jgi:hypothetical protein